MQRQELTQSEISGIAQAIKDEIYDYEYEEYFFPEGGPVGDVISSTRVRVPLYVDPEIRDGEGRAIYKLDAVWRSDTVFPCPKGRHS